MLICIIGLTCDRATWPVRSDILNEADHEPTYIIKPFLSFTPIKIQASYIKHLRNRNQLLSVFGDFPWCRRVQWAGNQVGIFCFTFLKIIFYSVYRAVRDAVLNSDLQGRLVAFVSMHAYSQLWIYPFSHKRFAYPSDIDELVILYNTH